LIRILKQFEVFMEKMTINGHVVDRIAGKGKKILFVHGANGGSWYWKEYMEKFNSAGYDVYANNLRGHGDDKSVDNIAEVSIFDYVSDTNAVIDEIKPDILFGHSMGGLISQMIVDSGKTFDALILACAAGPKEIRYRVSHPFKFLYYGMKQYKEVKKGGPLKLIYKMARTFALNNFTEEKAKEVFSKLVPESSRVLKEVGREKLVSITSKTLCENTLVIGATLDKTAPWKMEKDIASHYSADFMLLENFGHMFMIEKGWEDGANEIAEWLKEKGL
jgi:pimeloyl-ACP methyl ester carboxylesterase